MKTYVSTIQYAKHSSMIYGGPDLDAVVQDTEKQIEFYRPFGIRAVNIQATCDKCYNEGTYMVPVRGSRLIRKQKACGCKKAYLNEIITVNY